MYQISVRQYTTSQNVFWRARAANMRKYVLNAFVRTVSSPLYHTQHRNIYTVSQTSELTAVD